MLFRYNIIFYENILQCYLLLRNKFITLKNEGVGNRKDILLFLFEFSHFITNRLILPFLENSEIRWFISFNLLFKSQFKTAKILKFVCFSYTTFCVCPKLLPASCFKNRLLCDHKEIHSDCLLSHLLICPL